MTPPAPPEHSAGGSADRVQRVSPQQAAALLDGGDYRYLDVRTPQEFIAGHPLGAYNIPIALREGDRAIDNPDFLVTVRFHFAPTDRLLLGCRSGNRSLRAAVLLLDAQYTAVVEQRAGFEGVRDAFGGVTERGWKALGLPWSAEALPGRTWTELRQPS